MKTAAETETSPPTSASRQKAIGCLFFLDASGGRILTVNTDGSGRKVIAGGGRILASRSQIRWQLAGVLTRSL